MTGHTKTLRGRKLLSPITDNNKQFYQAPQSSTAKLTQPYPTQQTFFRRVPATDPAVTAALWARVRDVMPAETRAMGKNKDNDRGKGGRGRGRGGGRGQLGGGQHDSKKRKWNVPQGDEGEESDEEPGDILTAVETIETKLTSRNPHFQSLVLRPRRIIMEKNDGAYKNSYSHFETTAPPRGNLLDYKAIEGLDAAEIWLSLSNDQVERIIEEYQVMKNRRVCEGEYASFATENFLRRQRRFIKTPTDRKWRAERMIQLFAPPTGNSVWVAPPSFEESLEFKFDLRPDCSYWLSLAGFNSNYRSELNDTVYVHDLDWITCPYFTIVFKKHGQSVDQATWQACAAASIPLYNRYLLKRKALAVRAEEWTDFDRAQMKHYILTFVEFDYEIWVLRARFSEDSSTWDGCSMMSIWRATCLSRVGVQKLESWINEIHRWGLSGHSAGCQADVKTILEQNDVEISAIDLEGGE
jgi:hypothetical protein